MVSHCSSHATHYSHKMNISGIKQKMKLHHLTSTLFLASLFTVIKGQCETELSTLEACTGTDILDDTAMACQTCALTAPFLYFNGVYSCDDLQLAYCTQVDLCVGPETCGACIDQMEPLVGCLLKDYYSYGSTLGGCDLTACGTDTDQPPTAPWASGGTSMGSFTTILLSLASLLWV
jgi:hypothetical protein